MLKNLDEDVRSMIQELIQQAELTEGDICVLGCSSSEVVGKQIGKGSSAEVGEVIVKTLYEELAKEKVYLAVQACEHLNRALVIEKQAVTHGLEEVSVVPTLSAGGSAATAAYRYFNEPIMVEFIKAKAGIDIGDTAIGMHIKHVAVPIRLSTQQLGHAHVTALSSRPKLIGGARASY